MIIVCSICDSVEELFDPARLPRVDELRPSSCPLCGELAFSPGKRFGIVGHGTYQRQVLGVVDAAQAAITLVRRYLCRGCERTINILSDHLHPRRWYGGGAILEALELHLLKDLSEREIRKRFGITVDSESWRTLRRWRSELLLTLWYWLARRLGVRGTGQDSQRRTSAPQTALGRSRHQHEVVCRHDFALSTLRHRPLPGRLVARWA